jgi:hypothetical protein
LPEIDEAQQALLDELRNGERGSARHHFHQGMPSDLVQDILARLRQARPLPEEPRAVLLDGHPKDEKVIAEVEGFLRAQRVPTYVHRPQGDLRRDTERLTERLRTVGALVVCHGEVEATWAVSRLDEAIKEVFGTACPLQLFCTYMAPPDKDRRPYERYKLLQDMGRFAFLHAGAFAPLFDKLGGGTNA